MIALEKVSKIYPGSSVPAVNNVDLEVAEGEICVLIGSSGCGKTTLMRMMNSLIPITSGKIFINGQDVTQVDPIQLRRSVGYAIQQIGLFPHMTVQENIATVPRLLNWGKKEIQERVEELLTLVQLDPKTFAHRYPRELSGGQAQRIGVARAMAADPPVMLMDEPFGAIDPINREVLQDEFLKIQEKVKKTIIFVTHDIHEAVKMGDKIALLDAGRLIQYGSPEDLLTRPKNGFVREFVGADRALKRLDLLTVKDAMRTDLAHCLETDSGEEVLEQMVRNKLRYLLVTDEGQHLVGYVNLYDLKGHAGSVGEVVRPMTLTVTPDRNLKEALSKMLSYNLGIVVVVDDENRLCGILNSKTLFSVVGETYDEKGGHWDKVGVGGRLV